MGVFTPSPNSPNYYPFEDRNQRALGSSRPGDRLEKVSDFDLEAVLVSLAPLPPYSALVGICEDGLPLLLDLKNPASGSILVIGDLMEANRPLLRSLLASAVLLNTVEEVQLYLVSEAGDAFPEFQEAPGALEIISPHDPVVLDLIRRLVCRSRHQPCGRQSRGVEVVLVEDLEVLVAALDLRRRSKLEWLIEMGPQAGVWVIAGLEGARFENTRDVRVEAFSTQLIDAVDKKLLRKLAGLAGREKLAVNPGAQYCARKTGEFIPFWLPRYT